MSTVGGMVPMPRSATGDDGSFDAVAFGLVDVWQPGNGVNVVRATVAAGLDGPWRATTFDRFAGDGWLQSQGRSVGVGAGESLIGSGDISAMDATTTVTVRPEHYSDATLVSPGVALTADVRATLGMLDAAGMVERIRRDQGGAEYTVTVGSRSLRERDHPAAPPRRRPRLSGRGRRGLHTARCCCARSWRDRPSRRDRRDQRGSQSPSTTSRSRSSGSCRRTHASSTRPIRGLGCDCCRSFRSTASPGPARDSACSTRRRWPCSCARSTSRNPTRLVMGFLPGTRRDGVETVQMAGKHAWVEGLLPGDRLGVVRPDRSRGELDRGPLAGRGALESAAVP